MKRLEELFEEFCGCWCGGELWVALWMSLYTHFLRRLVFRGCISSRTGSVEVSPAVIFVSLNFLVLALNWNTAHRRSVCSSACCLHPAHVSSLGHSAPVSSCSKPTVGATEGQMLFHYLTVGFQPMWFDASGPVVEAQLTT